MVIFYIKYSTLYWLLYYKYRAWNMGILYNKYRARRMRPLCNKCRAQRIGALYNRYKARSIESLYNKYRAWSMLSLYNKYRAGLWSPSIITIGKHWSSTGEPRGNSQLGHVYMKESTDEFGLGPTNGQVPP